jgi:hypothetical protein
MTGQDLDLDRRLGELFNGPGLDVAPRAGATGTVLTRVRHVRRRRRALQVGMPVVTAALIAGTVLGSQNVGLLSAPAQPAAHPTQTVDADTGRTELAITGKAVGGLRLGMTPAQAEATGLVRLPILAAERGRPECPSYTGKQGIQTVEMGASGVRYIEVYQFIATEQGVSIGDSYAKLQAVYPASLPVMPTSAVEVKVPIPGQSGAWYVFGLEHQDDPRQDPTRQSRITHLALESADHSCT